MNKDHKSEAGNLHQKTEELLLKSEALYQSYLLASPDVIGITDLQGNIQFTSYNALAMFGYEKGDQTTTRNVTEFLVPEDRQRAEAEVLRMHQGIVAGPVEYRAIRANGSMIDVEVNGELIRNKEGEPTGVIYIIRDITQRKEVEKNLRNSEDRYRSIFQGSADGIMIADEENQNILFANSAQCQMFGYTEEQFKTMNIREIHPKDSFQFILAEFGRQAREEKTLAENIQCIKKNGEIFYADINSGPVVINGRKCVLGFFRDVTDRRKANDELLESQGLLNSIVETAKDSIFIKDTSLQYIKVNEAMASIFGLAKEDIIGKSDSYLFGAENAVHIEEIDRQVLTGLTVEEFPSKPVNGEIRHFHTIKVPLEDAHGQIYGLCGIARDITEHKLAEQEIRDLNANLELKILERTALLSETNENLQKEIEDRRLAEEALRENEAKYRSLIESTGTGYLILNWKGLVVDANSEYIRLSGHKDLTEILGRSVMEWTAGYEIQKSTAALERCIREGQIRNLVIDYVDTTGRITPVEINATFEGKGEAARIISICRDITDRKQAEDLVAQTRRNYETFFNTIDDFLFVLDEHGNMLHVNQTVKERLGYPIEELLGQSVLMVHPAERREEAGAIVGEMLAGTADFCPVPVITKSGTQIPVETRVRAGFWDGKPAIFGVTKDMSKIKWSEEKFSKAFQSNSTLMAISAFDTDLFIDVNDSFLKTLGYKRDEIIGKTFQELNLFPNSQDIKSIIEQLKLGVTVRELEIEVKTKSGELIVGLFSADFIFVGNTLCLLTVMVDITDRKRAEEEMWKSRNEAEKANLAKSEFLSRMSHELRTPMNSILGFAQLLDMAAMNPAHRKSINHILTSGRHLLNLINEVLDISRIEAGHLQLCPEPVKLSELIHEILDSVQIQADEQRLSMKLENLSGNRLSVMADRQRLKQVLLNLLNNAIKYNRIGGSVYIKTGKMPKNSFGTVPVRISITDTGSGINPDDIPKLFQPFERIGAERSETEGTGLGLAVVKKLMDAMGGIVGVESVPNEGSRFWLELTLVEDPKSQQDQKIDGSTPEALATEKARTILYIEENISNVELVELILSNLRPGIRLVTDPNGTQAVNLAKTYNPDLILLDLDLPDIHGSKVLVNLHADSGTTSIPVVIISADAMPKQIEQLMLNGARDYLTKPIDIIRFLKVVDDCLGL